VPSRRWCPRAEVEAPATATQLAKFNLSAACALAALDVGRFTFKPDITSTAEVRARVESQPEIATTRNNLNDALAKWWDTARDDFSGLVPQPNPLAATLGAASLATLTDARLPRVRTTLLDQLVRITLRIFGTSLPCTPQAGERLEAGSSKTVRSWSGNQQLTN
jgi:hypothetical protein